MKKTSNRFLRCSIIAMLAICIFASTFTIQALASSATQGVGIGFADATTGGGGSGGTGTTGTTESTTSTGEATTESSGEQTTGETTEESTSDGSTGSTKDPVEPNPNPSVPSTPDKGHGSTGKKPTTGDERSLVQLVSVMVLTVGLGIFLIFLLKKREKEEDKEEDKE